MDIGTGQGILAFWAVEAAKRFCRTTLSQDSTPAPVKVYAIEGNPLAAGEAYKNFADKHLLWRGNEAPGEVFVLNTSSYRLSEALIENKQIVERFDPVLWNSFENRKSFKAFDLIISETLGNIGDNEDVVCILDHAIDEFLREDGIVIPSRVTSFLVPIESVPSTEPKMTAREGEALTLHQSVGHRRYRCISTQYALPEIGDPFNMVYDAIIPLDDYVSEPQKVQEWCFNSSRDSRKTRQREYVRQISYRAKRNGLFSGFKGFFEAMLVDGQVDGEEVLLNIQSDNITGRETADCWKHMYLPIEKQIPIYKGDRIALDFRRDINKPEEESHFKYEWKGEVAHLNASNEPFSQAHKMSTPFSPRRESLISRFVKTFTLALEASHSNETVLPDSDREILDILEHSLRNDVLEGLYGLGSNKLADHQTASKNAGLRDFVRLQSDSRLQKCFLAFPSKERPGEYILVSASKSEATPLLSGGYTINYTIDPEAIDPKHFLTVDTKRYSEADLSLRFKELASKRKGFFSALIVPNSVHAEFSYEDLQDLHILMCFLQVRMFVDILSAAAQKYRLYSHQYLMRHELNQLAEALTVLWMDQPSDFLREEALKDPSLQWRETNWSVVPFPNLIESVGRMITLWSGHYSPEGIFPANLPIFTINDWVSACWFIAKENVKVVASWGIWCRNSNEILARSKLVDKRLEAVLDSTITSGSVLDSRDFPLSGARPENGALEDSGKLANWMELTRWFVSVISNYMRHGEIEKLGFRVRVETQVKENVESFCILAENSKRRRENVPSWWPKKGSGGSVSKPLLGLKGQDIQALLAGKLKAEQEERETEDSYLKGIKVKLTSLF